ncbi:hypothetical protein EYZ11_002052 [Aspergillus tanneri]|uniref:Uncharacterized protein n=1 Tax=Aspergillus tanneri TaxID=1220188 RepID=A0A4S3JTJ3_9EURO|nr:hypothetical protein EYZ11_002052 [Aspergillus tanneri]
MPNSDRPANGDTTGASTERFWRCLDQETQSIPQASGALFTEEVPKAIETAGSPYSSTIAERQARIIELEKQAKHHQAHTVFQRVELPKSLEEPESELEASTFHRPQLVAK